MCDVGTMHSLTQAHRDAHRPAQLDTDAPSARLMAHANSTHQRMTGNTRGLIIRHHSQGNCTVSVPLDGHCHPLPLALVRLRSWIHRQAQRRMVRLRVSSPSWMIKTHRHIAVGHGQILPRKKYDPFDHCYMTRSYRQSHCSGLRASKIIEAPWVRPRCAISGEGVG